MKRTDLHYELPADRIAQQPVEPRDAARLLVVHRSDGRLEHRQFRDLPDYLRPADALVLNRTRVVPARFFARRASGGSVEGLFLREASGHWITLLKPAGRLRPGERLRLLPAANLEVSSTDLGGEPAESGSDPSPAAEIAPDWGDRPAERAAALPTLELELIEREARGVWRSRPQPALPAFELLNRIGSTPLPPYIRGGVAAEGDAGRYQTVYADSPGAVAAPTAGLHFTPGLLERLSAAGIRQVRVTLHVGLGTFAPIDADDLAEHRMHSEWYQAPTAALETLSAARAGGGRIVAVGTTSVRVLESLAIDPGRQADDAPPAGEQGWTDIFIYPPRRFRNVDMLVTNFHLPESTLLALVMAFAGVALTRRAYEAAIAEGYRFYSYGDAMLVL